MPSTAERLSETWLDDQTPCDPWVITASCTDPSAWRDACLGNGLMGQRIPWHGDASAYGPGSASFMHGLWGAASENPARPEGVIELPHWAGLTVREGERDLRRDVARTREHSQHLDLRTGTVTTRHATTGSLGDLVVERAQWLSRSEPNLGVQTITITSPDGGQVEVIERLDNLHWHDAGPAPTATEGDDAVLDASSTRYGRRVVVRSRVVFAGDRPPGDPVVTQRDGLVRRVWRWRLAPGAVVTVSKCTAVVSDRCADDPAQRALALLDGPGSDLRALRTAHEAAWAKRWEHRIDLPHPRLQLLANVAFYHLYLTLRANVEWSHGPCGLTGAGWDGLVFWDTDTWTLPITCWFAPDLARGCVAYRHRTLPGARANAAHWGETGARYAWMSGEDGQECCSMPVFQNERHIVSCVALGQWLYARASGNDPWMQGEGRAVIIACAEYWAGKAIENPDGSWSINGVCGPDEHAGVVDDNATTNVGAAWTLRKAAQLMADAGEAPPPSWQRIADGLAIHWDDERGIPKQMKSWQHGQTIKQADATLMVYPWQHDFESETKRKLVDYYRAHYPEHPIMMGRAIDAVVDCELGRPEAAWRAMGQLLPHHTLPFYNVTEDAVNERIAFLTGSGGLLQLLTAGFAGLREREDGLHLRPALPQALPWIRLHGIHHQGRACTVTCHADGRVEGELPPGVTVD